MSEGARVDLTVSAPAEWFYADPQPEPLVPATVLSFDPVRKRYRLRHMSLATYADADDVEALEVLGD